MNENSRLRRGAVCGWMTASVAAAVCLSVASTAFAVVTVKVATENGMRGGTVRLTLSMAREGGEGSVATLNTDVIFDTTQLNLVGSCGNGDPCGTTSDCGEGDFCRFSPTACRKSSRLSEQTVEVTPPDFQNVPPGKRRVRFAIVGTRLPVPTFEDGELVTCTFQVPTDAPFGQQILSTDRLQVADNSIPARPLPSVIVIEAGSIVPGTPGPTVTATMSGTPATATPTAGSPLPTATHTMVGGTSTPATATPTEGPVVCPSPRVAPTGPALYVEDINLNAPGDATITVRLVSGSAQVAGTQNDIEFGGNVIIKRRVNGRPDCTVNAAIDKSATSFAFRPPSCTEATCNAVRALVLSTENTDPIVNGSVLYTCNVTVAASGGELVVSGVIMSNPTGQRVDGATGRNGLVCVNRRPPDPTGTPTDFGTVGNPPTRTPTVTPTTAVSTRTNTPRATATNTPRTTAAGTPKPGGGGGGCNCDIGSGQPSYGMASMWLALPAAILLRRRRRLS
jgi:hypothetical protein